MVNDCKLLKKTSLPAAHLHWHPFFGTHKPERICACVRLCKSKMCHHAFLTLKPVLIIVLLYCWYCTAQARLIQQVEVVHLLSWERLPCFISCEEESYVVLCSVLGVCSMICKEHSLRCLTYYFFLLLILTWHFYTEAVAAGEQQSMSQTVILLKLTDWGILLLSLAWSLRQLSTTYFF